MNSKEYITKSITIIVTTIASTVAISSLIIGFDFVTFISCCVSTITAIIFGWTTMLKNETYWTDEYLQYALYVTNQEDKNNGNNN